ncbi:hypothetical protein [Tropicibacter sp. S64]|uniref:hypothetical protein n=1 Tax=Tropicibacter sp. S64 TaxID=3415122 RepID=UPI003C7ED470
MTFARALIASLSVTIALAPMPSLAQTVLSGDHSVDGNLCVGTACTGSESFLDGVDLKIKNSNPVLLFEDTSDGIDFPTRDWAIETNGRTSGSDSYFAVRDVDSGNQIFRILETAPENSLVVNRIGSVGVGTLIPQATLHVVSDTPAIRIQQGNAYFSWGLNVDSLGFKLQEHPSIRSPFIVRSGAPSAALAIGESGDVGVGTSTPDAALNVVRLDDARIHVRNSTTTPAVREMFKMTNNGGSYFTLDNTNAGTTWFFSHEQASPNRFIITDGVADGPEMTLTAEGLLTVQGGFTVGGTLLNVPDYVFGENYALRPLSEVKDFIAANSHLPEVPSAAQIRAEGLDMTTMQLTLLKKVEELTLYTLEQEAELSARKDENAALRARLAEQDARLDALEALIRAR